MVEPVKPVHQEARVAEKLRQPLDAVVVQVTCVVIDDPQGGCRKAIKS